MKASDCDTLGFGEFQLINVNGGRLGRDDWVIRGTSDIFANEMGVYVVLDRGARLGGGNGVKESAIEVSWSVFHVSGSGRGGGNVMKRLIRTGNGGKELGAYHIKIISHG